MNDIIEKMGQLEIPDELLKQVDVNEVLEKFRRNFRKLDALKDARSRHESRNAVMRWWHSDEMEEAQLDAQQLQAEFSKSLGQLMLLSMLQSQKLSAQQHQLGRQQDEIVLQNELIKAQADALSQQQTALSTQSKELEQLVNQYFDLRGLTQEGARQLITIAADVKATRDALLARFDGQLRETAEQAAQLRERADRLATEVNHGLNGAAAHRAGVDHQLASLREVLSTQEAAAAQHRQGTAVQLQRLRIAVGALLAGVIGALGYLVWAAAR
jgi:hypothetical protein